MTDEQRARYLLREALPSVCRCYERITEFRCPCYTDGDGADCTCSEEARLSSLIKDIEKFLGEQK